MQEIVCVLGYRIKLTDERMLHIAVRHPEIEDQEDDIIKTLKDADFVQKSVYDENVLLYYRCLGKYTHFVVAVKLLNNAGFNNSLHSKCR